MRRLVARKLGTVAPIALIAALGAPAFAGTLDDDVLIGTSGGGYIFADPAEGVLEPGIRAVTFTKTRIGDGQTAEYVEPFEAIETDFETLTKRSQVTNCLLANNPEVYCDSERGSGKRIKTRLTGPEALDIRMRTTPSDEFAEVDYFTFGKTSNLTGARITDLSIQLLDADGNLMNPETPEAAVLFNLAASAIGLGANLPDGLYGSGGNEGEIGFFSDDAAELDLAASANTLDFGALSNADGHYATYFGNALLDDTMVPDGLFWDDNADPADESALIAWNNISGGGWTYGIIELGDDAIEARKIELAAALGVEVDALNYVPGGPVPQEIVDAAQANGLFSVAIIEDLRNANLNFTITVGNVEAGEFTLRLAPGFAPIVEAATTEYQFRTAGYLDAAANVPYWDLGDADAYAAEITRILALEPAEQADALEQIGFSFLGAFSGLGMNLGRDQVFALGRPSVEIGTDGVTLSSKGDGSWSMGDDLRGFASIHGSSGSYETTANSIGYDVDTRGFSAGVETAISPTMSVGVMVGGLDGTAEAFAGRGEIDASGWSVAAYGRTTFGVGGSLQAVVGYQDLSFDTTRNVAGMVAEGSTDGSQTFMALQADYMFRQGALTWGPMASIERYDISVDGFTETGADIWNLAVGEQDGAVTLVSAGVRGEYAVDAAGNTRAYGSLAMTKASGDDAMIAAGFVGLPSGSTPVDGIDQDWVDVNLGMTTTIPGFGGKGAVLGGEYRGSFGDDYENHGLGVFVKMAF